ncbi:hypothetical protein GCM10018965_020500 [Nonomuraea roseola]
MPSPASAVCSSKEARLRVRRRNNASRAAVHELSHDMEKVVLGLAALEQAFSWSRTATGPVGERQRTLAAGAEAEGIFEGWMRGGSAGPTPAAGSRERGRSPTARRYGQACP